MHIIRTPIETPTTRMAPLARLPVFFALDGKRALVAGNGAAAAWKAELLSAAGATVDVYADAASDDLRAVTAEAPRAPIVLHGRAWNEDDFAHIAIAVGEFDDEHEADRFVTAARSKGVPVNVIDKPAFCDFSFGAIVNRSPLVVAISTDGAAPAFGQAIRSRIEALLPRGFAHWVEAAQRWRAVLRQSGLPMAVRRAFWRRFAALALTNPDREPAAADLDRLMADAGTADGERTAPAGCVTLVGAGPGDPELLTLRAVRALQTADAILIDDLVAPAILDYARREAKKFMVGKTGFGPACRQDEINTLMLALARAGKRVVRLKGGDPMIFGRATEEIAACRAAGVEIEVVPGITAAQGAAARLNVSLTQRRDARRLQYVTGHAADGRLPDDIVWTSVADPVASTVVYMPKRTIGEFADGAIARGLAADTPAVAVAAATRPDEAIVAGTVGDIAAKLAALAHPGPVLVFVGRAFEAVGARIPATEPAASPAQSAT